jgi:Ca2+-binding RTX toxin-like protein
MELTTNFLQGISAAGGYFYARAVADEGNGLFLMDVRTGEVSILHINNTFHSISYLENGIFRGWATNQESGDSYLYEFSTLTGSLSALGNIENAGNINYAQGVYSFDVSENALYVKGFRYVDIESGAMEWGLFNFDLSSGQLSFEENDNVAEWSHFEIVDGNLVYFIAGSAYSIPQGVMTHDKVNSLFYTTSWIFDLNSGAITGQQILQLGKNADVLEVLESFEIRHDEFVHDIVYDAENEVFFAVIQDGNSNIVVAVDFSGNLFNVGSKNNDNYVGTMSDDNYLGMGGADNLVGNGGNDMLIGGAGHDSLTGGSGDDLVDAGAGNDLIVGGDGAGDDTYNGGTGIDTIKYTSATAGITVNLGANSNQAKSTLSGDKAGIGIDQLSGIENVIAGKYNDIVKGNTVVNVLDGGAGNDTLDGSTGNDVLKGGTGKDVLYGGSGADKFVFDTALNQSTNLDTIKDFARNSDKIVLDDDIFKAFTGKSGVSSKQFKVVDKVSQLSGDGHLTYVRANDTLYYDANGKGSGDVAFVKIELAGNAAPSASDFQVIA